MATNIKDKIAKLLALAESPNENEARAALLKARELMAEHKLRPEDVKRPKGKGHPQGPGHHLHRHDQSLGRVPLRCCCGALLLPSLPLPERGSKKNKIAWWAGRGLRDASEL